MPTVLMAEFARATSEELQRHAASVRMARAAAGARHPRRRPRVRRRLLISRRRSSPSRGGSPAALQGNGSGQNARAPI
jgi:hypothetical protein